MSATKVDVHRAYVYVSSPRRRVGNNVTDDKNTNDGSFNMDGMKEAVLNPNPPTTSSSNSVFSGDESSSSAFNMESLKAGLATVSTDHANLKGRVSRLEGKFENWEEVLNQIKLQFDIDTDLKGEVDFLTFSSQTLLNSLKQRIDSCGESNTYFRSKISELEKSMKFIDNKNVELQDTINSLGKAAGNGGANFISSLQELKKMQENYSHLKIELETRFAQELPRFGSKQVTLFFVVAKRPTFPQPPEDVPTVEYAAEALSHDMISRIRVANCQACAK